jgi:hypothetical protein
MASVLTFPSRFLNPTPAERTRLSPVAEEAAEVKAQRGLRIVPEGGFRKPESTLEFSNVIGVVLAQIDGEIATQAGRERAGRLLSGEGPQFSGADQLFPGSAA